MNGKNILLDYFQFTLIGRKGLWNQSKMVDELQNKTFSLILLPGDINNTKGNTMIRITNAIKNNYHLIDKIGESCYVYKPNNKYGVRMN